MEFQTVRVADIAEFPTELGSRCLLLLELGLNAYWDTEEELLDALTKSATKPACLEICLKSSRCKGFFETFAQGQTPFKEHDPIRLLEHEGHYWAVEGKHRVCLAKRTGIHALEAIVCHLSKDTETLLPHEGEPGRHRFSFTLKQNTQGYFEAQGTVASLWVKNPPGIAPGKFGFQCVWLDVSQDTGGAATSVFRGLQYRVLVQKKSEKSWFSQRRPITTVEVDVLIGSDHPRTKIWLAEWPAKDIIRMDTSSFRTIYRRGCWRQGHFWQMRNMLPVVQS